MRALLGSASILEQKAFLKSFVKGIDVSNSEIIVNHTLPMPLIERDGEIVQSLLLCKMAGELGFEPSLADPESAVLPLDYSPARKIF